MAVPDDNILNMSIGVFYPHVSSLPASQPKQSVLSDIVTNDDSTLTFFHVTQPMPHAKRFSNITCDRGNRQVIRKTIEECLLCLINKVARIKGVWVIALRQ